MGKLFYAIGLLVLALGLVHNWYFTYDFVKVETDKGTIRGFNTTSWRGAKYSAFKGIPYAKPPLGELRFKGPEEEPAWAGVRDALAHGNVCPHVDLVTPILWGQEDCLFLNVYTPDVEAERLPVMVWIHGGAFFYGSGNDDLFGPDYFMEAGVVLVTINYRLGALGFLSTEDDGAPGNAGLKDQVAALRWVRRNIAKFGGDPENVTIFGESAGSASTHYHLLSPMSSGLFTKAIGQSGSALNPWALVENPAELTIRLAEALGAKNIAGDTSRALEFLKTAPFEDIIRIQVKLRTPAEEKVPLKLLFIPSVEKGVKSEEVFLPDSPLKILESGNFNKVPWMTGYTSHEGYFFYKEISGPEGMLRAFEDTDVYVPPEIKNEKLRSELAESIRKFYFDDKPIGIENITNLVHLLTDFCAVTGTLRATKLQLQSTNTPTYFYRFSYDGGLNLGKIFSFDDLPGASHADDLGYMFYQRIFFWRKPAVGSEDEWVLDTMVRLWTNFAKYGNPTPSGDPLTWEPVTTDKFSYLHISGRDTKLAEDPDPERASFWVKAYEKYAALN